MWCIVILLCIYIDKFIYYRKRGSASYIVRQWLLYVVERERDACDVIDITLKSRVIMHMITFCLLSLSSARMWRQGAWRLSARLSSRVEGMTMGKWKLCVRWSTCRKPPSSISLAFSARRIDQVDVYFLFGMAAVLALRTARIAVQYPFGSVPARCTKTCNAVGNVVAETGSDLVFGTTARLSDLSMPLAGEVRRSPEPSARPSAAADSEERQICTTCLFAESVGLCLCFLPLCAMYKDNAVANVVAEMGRDLVCMTTARLSDLSMPLKGEVRRSPEQSARQPKARSGKFAWRAYYYCQCFMDSANRENFPWSRAFPESKLHQ